MSGGRGIGRGTQDVEVSQGKSPVLLVRMSFLAIHSQVAIYMPSERVRVNKRGKA